MSSGEPFFRSLLLLEQELSIVLHVHRLIPIILLLHYFEIVILQSVPGYHLLLLQLLLVLRIHFLFQLLLFLRQGSYIQWKLIWCLRFQSIFVNSFIIMVPNLRDMLIFLLITRTLGCMVNNWDIWSSNSIFVIGNTPTHHWVHPL